MESGKDCQFIAAANWLNCLEKLSGIERISSQASKGQLINRRSLSSIQKADFSPDCISIKRSLSSSSLPLIKSLKADASKCASNQSELSENSSSSSSKLTQLVQLIDTFRSIYSTSKSNVQMFGEMKNKSQISYSTDIHGFDELSSNYIVSTVVKIGKDVTFEIEEGSAKLSFEKACHQTISFLKNVLFLIDCFKLGLFHL